MFKENEILMCEARIPKVMYELYPSIAFEAVSYGLSNDKTIVVTEANLHFVSLCNTPNLNPSIKKISKQLN